MNCHNCGEAPLELEHGLHEYDAVGLPYPVILVGIPIERCPECGESVVTIPDPEGLHQVLALQIVEADRLVLPAEIRFLRKVLDKSADDMATLMGIDAKTLSRWENGKQKMGKVAERLIRLLVHQRLAPDAVTFAEDVFPRMDTKRVGEVAPVKFSTSESGWQQQAA